MITIKGYTPNPSGWVSNQAYIRGYLDTALKPVSAVMTFLKEGNIVRPRGLILNDIRNLARRGQYSLDLCLEYLKAPRPSVNHSYRVSISGARDTGKTRIKIDDYPEIVF